MRRAICLACALLVSACASSEEPESPILPPQRAERMGAATALERAPVTQLRLGGFTVELARTTLGDAQYTTAIGAIREQGQDEQRRSWLCYTVGAAETFDRVWLIAARSGGPERRIVIVIAEVTSVGGDEQCPLLPSRFQPASFDGGLWLRAPREALMTRLGAPSGDESRELRYSFSGQETVATGEGTRERDVTASLVAELQGGFVVRLTASKTIKD